MLTARRGREYLPPPPGRLAGYLNLAAVHSLERELSLLLINSGKYLGKIYFTTKILFFLSSAFFADVTCIGNGGMLIISIDRYLRGGVLEKSTFFKELTPHSWTYELRGLGGEKNDKIKANKHLTLSYEKRPRGEKK